MYCTVLYNRLANGYVEKLIVGQIYLHTPIQSVHKNRTLRLEEDQSRIPSKTVEFGRLHQKTATFRPGYMGH